MSCECKCRLWWHHISAFWFALLLRLQHTLQFCTASCNRYAVSSKRWSKQHLLSRLITATYITMSDCCSFKASKSWQSQCKYWLQSCKDVGYCCTITPHYGSIQKVFNYSSVQKVVTNFNCTYCQKRKEEGCWGCRIEDGRKQKSADLTHQTSEI